MENRRNFLKRSALCSGGIATSMLFPTALLASIRKAVSPNDRIQVGLIGCNGMGFTNLISFLKMGEIELVALCDVDKNVLSSRTADLEKAGINKPKWYNDYRRLLEDKDVDVVIIGTPDHWHCLQLVDAIAAEKDVYCEKPIANSIAESNIMLAAVNGSDRMVQVGQWQRSQPHFVDAINFVHSGKLGQIRLAKAWAYQGWMSSIPVLPNTAVPNGVDYDMWLGPALKRPFNPNRFHFNFRWFWDYAGGLMTDWGVHLMDYALYGMKLAEKYGENPDVCNAIGSHHDETEMSSLIAPVVQVCDAISGARPGARREVAESYIKRIKELEELALSEEGVVKTYAIQAGRELRVIVGSDKVSDKDIDRISDNVAKRIEEQMTYPGQIKITVIREKRSVSYAK